MDEKIPHLAIAPAWMPPSSQDCMIDPVKVTPKIDKIEPLQIKSHDFKLKLHNFYRCHLKQYAVVQWIALWIWRNGYPLYVKYIFAHIGTKSDRAAKRLRQIVPLSDFVKAAGMLSYKLADSEVVAMPTPVVFPLSDQSSLVSPHDAYKFPEIYVASLKNVMIHGGTNFVMTGNDVVCHDLYDFNRDRTSEELHLCALINPKSNQMRWLLIDKNPELMSVAATFVDACAYNYAHWMTEVLPRVAMFCAEERFHGVPIVVNDGLHKNIMESLLRVVGDKREIVTLPIGRALVVDELYVTSVTGYVPFGQRNKKLSGHSHGKFSPHALALVRKHMHAFLKNPDREKWPNKIFLRRNSGVRKANNAAEIEILMVSRGYEIVEPERLTFSQQVQLFSNANIIVAPTGAALASAMFCKPGAKVAVFMAKHPDMIYRYWMDMLTPNKVDVSYLLCSIVGNKSLGLHGDYRVNIKDLTHLLESLEEK